METVDETFCLFLYVYLDSCTRARTSEQETQQTHKNLLRRKAKE